jgi:hypothetical protein
MSTPTVTYNDIFAPDYSVTGIRQDAGDGHPVVITGSYQPSGGGPSACCTAGRCIPPTATATSS